MIICPKCNVSNDEIYTFCVECGATLPKIPNDSFDSIATIVIPPDKLPEPTVLIPPDRLPETQPYSPANTVKNEASPTVQMPPQNVPATQYYSPAQIVENQVPPTIQMSSDKLPETVQHSNQQLPPTQQYSPPKSDKIEIPPPLTPEKFGTNPDTNQTSKKSKKMFWIVGFFLLLLLGGGTAAYFLHQPRQANKSYLLTDKHQENDKVLDFNDQNSTFLMGDTKDNASQKWQITPDPDNKDYYRFVNRGLGENESLEVIDDNQDSSVTMAQSAQDVGQLWAMTNVQGDYYRITNQWLGDSKSLSHSKQYYFFLRIRDSNNNDGQLWKKRPAQNGQGFYLTNKQYGDTVSLQALNKDEFKDKLVMKSGEYGNRQWELTDLGTGFYTLTTIADGKFLDVNPNKKEHIIMAASGNSPGQRWKMTPVGNDYFRLTNESLGDGKSLEAVTFSKYTVEMVKSSDADPGQLWKITKIK